MKKAATTLPAGAAQALSDSKGVELTPAQKAAKTRANNKAAADAKAKEPIKGSGITLPKDGQAGQPEEEKVTLRPLSPQTVDNVPTVSVEEEEPEVVGPVSPWVNVKELHDDEMQVEAVSIFGYQFRMCLLRVRLDGKLTGQVIPVERTIYHATKGFQQNR